MSRWVSSVALAVALSGCAGKVVTSNAASVTPENPDADPDIHEVDGEQTGPRGSTDAGSGSDSGGSTGSTGGGSDAGRGGTDAAQTVPPRDASADTGPRTVDPPVTRTPSPCPAANAPMGGWEQINPPGVTLSTQFVVNPKDSAVVTLGTGQQGIWQSKDCGATWKHINTGRNGAALDKGSQWSMVIDPQEPNTIYTVSGYGENGVFKTTNGGVDWDQILSQEVFNAFPFGGFSHQIVIDPTNHLHLTVNPHFDCNNGPCIAETEDGGKTWRLISNTPGAGEGSGRAMENHDTWFVMMGFGGVYRTTNAGRNWTLVGQRDGYAHNSFFKAPDGTRYIPASFNVISSKDGVTWQDVKNSPGGQVLTGSPTTVWASTSSCIIDGDPVQGVYYAPLSDPTNWKRLEGPGLRSGADRLEYDVDHKLLYVSACRAGFWRIHTDK